MSVFRGTLVDTPSPGELRIRRDHVICTSPAVECLTTLQLTRRTTAVDTHGVITHLSPASSTPSDLVAQAIPLPERGFLLPTFADLHLHAPQYLNAGIGLDLPLMEWLDEYTYVAEERVDADPELARRLYARLVERLIEAGTGCVVAFGTIGVQAK
jgi:guanine deaminase